MTNSLKLNVERARDLMKSLYSAFLPDGPGIFGIHSMPEDVLPANVRRGSTEHLIHITLGVSVDYMRDADQLWRALKAAHEDEPTKYLFHPQSVYDRGLVNVRSDLKRLGISRKHERDSRAWFNISRALYRKWDSDPRKFLESCRWHAPTVLVRLKKDYSMGPHDPEPDFPLLQGAKISPLWIRMLRDNCDIEFNGFNEIDIAVDVHVLRATLCTGALTGKYEGGREVVFEQVRKLWREAAHGLRRPDGKPMAALDIDEALWTLSRNGCALRGNGHLKPCNNACPATPGCANGIIEIQDNSCRIDT